MSGRDALPWMHSVGLRLTTRTTRDLRVSITKIANFCPLGPFCPFKKGPLTHQKWKFSNFFCFNLSHWAYFYLPKNMFLSPKLRLLKGPLKLNIFQHYIFFLHFFVTLSQHTKRLCLYAHNYVFWLLGPFLKIKGPLKGAEMQIFKNRWKPHVMVS